MRSTLQTNGPIFSFSFQTNSPTFFRVTVGFLEIVNSILNDSSATSISENRWIGLSNISWNLHKSSIFLDSKCQNLNQFMPITSISIMIYGNNSSSRTTTIMVMITRLQKWGMASQNWSFLNGSGSTRAATTANTERAEWKIQTDRWNKSKFLPGTNPQVSGFWIFFW